MTPADARARGRGGGGPGAWDHTLLLGFAAVVAGGLLLVLAPDAPLLDGVNRTVHRAFRHGTAPGGTDALQGWLYALLGSVLVGFGVLGAGVVGTAFRRRERWARNALVLSLAAWFVLDSGASLAWGIWQNAVLNVALAVLLLVPVLAVWGRFPPGGGARKGGTPEAEGEAAHGAARPAARDAVGRGAARPASGGIEPTPSASADASSLHPGALVVWEAPAPRSGWRGAADRFFGPGANGAEYALQAVAVAVLSGAALAWTARVPGSRSFSGMEWIVLALLAVDITGGVVTNATSAGKRWYHRPGQGLVQHLRFVAVHGAHLGLFAGVLHGVGWEAAACCYGALLVTAVVVATAPLYLQRPLAMALFAGLLLLSLEVVPVGSPVAWFLPLFFLKLTVGHLVPEAPFRPAPSSP